MRRSADFCRLNMIRSKPNIDPQKKYCVKVACYELEICEDTLRKYRDSGLIGCIRITSREIYYLGSDLLALWETMQKHKKYD